MTEPGAEFDAEFTDLFRDEATARLEQMDKALLAIEAGEAGAETINELFRGAHTIKGSAGMLGFDDIRALAHAVEDVLAWVRAAGEFPPDLTGPLLRATDALRAQVAGGEPAIGEILKELSSSRTARSDGAARGAGARPAGAGAPGSGAPGHGVPGAGVPGGGVPGIRAREPKAALAWVAEADDAGAGGSGPALPEGSVPEARRVAAPAVPVQGPDRPAQANRGRGPEPDGRTEDSGRADGSGSDEGAGRSADPGRGEGSGRGGRGGQDARRSSGLRVSPEKIDHLLDIVGEVKQYRRRLTHSLGEQRLAQDVVDVLVETDQLLDELKDTAIGMRTLPLAMIAGPLPRAIRDLAHANGKAVELVISGADTEIDRVILESMSEPIVHLLRNAVNHGIEPPAERELAGKPETGRVELRAVPRGSLVEIVVADDGRGVSPLVIEEARRAGSLAEVLTRPGYSTAADVTELAGRGVGLDAVKSYVQSLGGSLEVRSEPGRGMEVVLLLPLALALLDVLLFERGRAVYGVPLAVVEQAVMVTGTLMLEGRPALEVHGRALPVADFAALVGAAAPPLPARPPGFVMSVGGRRVVAACDALGGEQEVVVKPLGPLFRGVDGYLGATILPDGRIGLLVEPAVLTRTDRNQAGLAPFAVAPASPPKVLVVEDSFTIRELQRSILEAAGYPVATARDGREALQTLGRDREIALVVTDYEMPELDGLELTRAIRTDPALAALPVVIVTSRGSDEDQRQGIEAGADAYMAKGSFNQQALLATVERLVGR